MMILAVLVGTLSCAIISLGHIKQDLDMLKLDDATLERMAKEQEEAMLNPKEEEK